MHIAVVQSQKGLYDAMFNIVSVERNEVFGNVTLKGSLGSMEATIQVTYLGNQSVLSPVSNKVAVKEAGNYIDCSFSKRPVRSYSIENGWDKGIAFIHPSRKSDACRFLRINGENYYTYVLGFGEKGICAPVYKNDRCIAEIQKGCYITDDLHTFNIFVESESDVIPLILEVCHYYVTAYYKAGQVIKGNSKHIFITKDKDSLALCKNPYYLSN